MGLTVRKGTGLWVAVVLLLVASRAAADKLPQLTIVADKSEYAVGEAPLLTFTVINHGADALLVGLGEDFIVGVHARKVRPSLRSATVVNFCTTAVAEFVGPAPDPIVLAPSASASFTIQLAPFAGFGQLLGEPPGVAMGVTASAWRTTFSSRGPRTQRCVSRLLGAGHYELVFDYRSHALSGKEIKVSSKVPIHVVE